MDFSSLAYAPLAAVLTILIILVGSLAKRYTVGRRLTLAAASSFLVNVLIDQPWYYRNTTALGEGLFTVVIFSLIGFCIGGVIALAILQTGRLISSLLTGRR